MLLGVEGRMLETMQEYQQKREDRLLEAIERSEARVEEMGKKKEHPRWMFWK